MRTQRRQPQHGSAYNRRPPYYDCPPLLMRWVQARVFLTCVHHPTATTAVCGAVYNKHTHTHTHTHTHYNRPPLLMRWVQARKIRALGITYVQNREATIVTGNRCGPTLPDSTIARDYLCRDYWHQTESHACISKMATIVAGKRF